MKFLVFISALLSLFVFAFPISADLLRYAGAMINISDHPSLCLAKEENSTVERLIAYQRDTPSRANNTLLRLWVDCNWLQEVEGGGENVELKRWAILVAARGKNGKEVLFRGLTRERYLRDVEKTLKISGDNIAKMIDKQAPDLLNGANKKYLGNETAIDVGGVINLGLLALTDAAHIGMLANVKGDYGYDKLIAVIMASTVLKGAVIHHDEFSEYNNEKTLDSLLRSSKTFSARLVLRNR
jgi:hypothetical protein